MDCVLSVDLVRRNTSAVKSHGRAKERGIAQANSRVLPTIFRNGLIIGPRVARYLDLN